MRAGSRWSPPSSPLPCRCWYGPRSIPANPGFQLVEKYNWLGGGISYHMGVDGISMLFVVLTAGLMPFCIAASWKSVETSASPNT